MADDDKGGIRDDHFWMDLDALIRGHRIVIERPRGSAHPASPDQTYPLDYGYLDGTRSDDGDAVDVWVGTRQRTVVGVVCTVDGLKAEIETKLLIGCSDVEIVAVQRFFEQLRMGCCVWLRETGHGRP